MGAKLKVKTEDILSTYARLGSVWATGKELGICGQSVHERLQKLGVDTSQNNLSDSDKAVIVATYEAGFDKGDGILPALAKSLGRTKAFICRFARSQGLSNLARTNCESLSQEMGQRTKARIKANGHPKGALGMKHSDGTKMRLSWSSRAKWESKSEIEKDGMIRKQLMGRLKKHGTLITHNRKTTWKQAWRVIDGRRIYFRSRWEFNYGLYLQFLKERKQIMEWEHEPETFWFDGIRRGCVSYLPDYRVINLDGSIEYHEVKGWMDDRSKTKLKRMKKFYPHIKLRVIDGKWFKANAAKLTFLKGWEESGKIAVAQPAPLPQQSVRPFYKPTNT